MNNERQICIIDLLWYQRSKERTNDEMWLDQVGRFNHLLRRQGIFDRNGMLPRQDEEEPLRERVVSRTEEEDLHGCQAKNCVRRIVLLSIASFSTRTPTYADVRMSVRILGRWRIFFPSGLLIFGHGSLV